MSSRTVIELRTVGRGSGRVRDIDAAHAHRTRHRWHRRPRRSAVAATLLGDGWRVVVPWIAERELERVPERDGLELVRADLFDPDDVAPRRSRGRRARGAAARRRQPRRRLRRRPARRRHADRRTSRSSSASTCARRTSSRQAALPAPAAAGGGRSSACPRARRCDPFAGAAGYCASKAAVLAFAAGRRAEGRKDGIRCNAILPSVIETPANRAAMPEADGEAGAAGADRARRSRSCCEDCAAASTAPRVPVYGDADPSRRRTRSPCPRGRACRARCRSR